MDAREIKIGPPPGLSELGSLVHVALPAGLVTHDDLERHEREAAELHSQAAELRARLDVPPPPVTPHPRRRSALGLSAAGAVVVIGAAGAILAGTHPWTSDDPSRGSTAGAVAEPGASAGVRVPAGLGLPAAGPGINAEGTALGIRLTGATDSGLGKLRVSQRIVLGPRGVRDLDLTQTTTPGLDGDAARLKPSVSGLKAQVNGTEATVQKTAAGWTVTAADGRRARVVLLEFDLDDAVALSTPSTSGRALGLVPPLAITGNAASPLLARTASSQAIGMVCPGAAPAQMLCGRSEAGGWQATVPADTASQSVLLQLDLKAPRS